MHARARNLTHKDILVLSHSASMHDALRLLSQRAEVPCQGLTPGFH